MKSPALLLFLELEGVLVVGGSAKRALVMETVSAIARGDSQWRDHHELWQRLFAPEPVRQLKALHDQFQPLYCLTTDWTGFVDKATMLNVLRLSGLGFVAGNLHARWEIDKGLKALRRCEEIENWLRVHSDQQDQWVVLDTEVHGPGRQDWPEELLAFGVFCCADVGLTEFESEEIRMRFLQRLRFKSGDSGEEVTNVEPSGSFD